MAFIAAGACSVCLSDFERSYTTRRPTKCRACDDRQRGRHQRQCLRCDANIGRRRRLCDDCVRAAEDAHGRRKRQSRASTVGCSECGGAFFPGNGSRARLGKCLECVPTGDRSASRANEKAKRRSGGMRSIEDIRSEASMRADAADRDREEARKRLIEAKPWLTPGLTLKEKRRLRYRCDQTFNVAERVRIQMRSRRRFKNMEHTIRKAVAGKVTTPSIEMFVGYSMRTLRDHLELLFLPGMTWEAFCAGLIHIDHRRPVASFNLNDENQVRSCWALSNLQPMWAAENMRKGAKYGEEGSDDMPVNVGARGGKDLRVHTAMASSA